MLLRCAKTYGRETDMEWKRLVLASVFGGASVAGGAAEAADVHGMVRDSAGAPIAGAIVSLADDARGVTEDVYSDSKGQFRLETSLQGDLSVRVRQFYFDDYRGKVHLSKSTSLANDVTLVRHAPDSH